MQLATLVVAASIDFASFQRIGVSPQELKAFVTSPLIELASYVRKLSRTERGLQVINNQLPFDVQQSL